jgi:(p)ppGpp synthase/HD superfamily hydrolase
MWKGLFQKAKVLAIEAHGAQRYGDRPYADHLAAVVGVLERFGGSLEDEWTAPILVAAWLHDALEDTALTKDAIQEQVGDIVADLVWRVTDEPGANRKARKAATYPKLQQNERAVILKLADRIANVEESLRNNPRLLGMYRKEYLDFVDALQPACTSTIARTMWSHLNLLLSRDPGESP